MFREHKGPSKPSVALWQGRELGGRWRPRFIPRAVGTRGRVRIKRVMLSDLSCSRSPLVPIGGRPSGPNGVGETAGSARVRAGGSARAYREGGLRGRAEGPQALPMEPTGWRPVTV